MMRKRLLCAVMALILLFSAQPMVTAANTENQRSTTIQASCRLPVIRVAVPPIAGTYINPLKLPVSIGGEESNAQIVSVPACLANYSEVPLAVNATVTGTVYAKSDMQLVSSPTNGVGTEKNAFVYFEMQTANTGDLDYVKWAKSYDPNKHILLVDQTSVTKENIVTLAAGTLDGEVAKGGYAPFRLTGDAVKKPQTAWSGKDGLSVSIAFTFTPLYYDTKP